MSFSKLSIRGCSYEPDAHGHHVFHVDSPHALMQAAGYLKYVCEPWERIFLRGQSSLYERLSPSLYRGLTNSKSSSIHHGRLNKVIQEFSAGSRLFRDVPDHAKEPLLQHYGIKTTWLDVVDNVWIALWFAIHRASVSGNNSEYMHFDQRRYPVDGEFAYILLIRAEDDRDEPVRAGVIKGKKTEVIDLRAAASSVYVRPHAQHGLLFRERGTANGRSVDYISHVAGAIRIKLSDAIDWLGTGDMHNIRGLFPPPFFDGGYRTLLNVNQIEKRLGVITHIGA